jgi:hypothetical protein
MTVIRWAAVLAAASFLVQAPRAEEQHGYRNPEWRVGKYSFVFETNYQDYQGEHFNRDIFFGGTFDKTYLRGEYGFNFSGYYQFTKRFSMGLRTGYAKTKVLSPWGYDSDRVFDIINDKSDAIIECAPVTENFTTVYCDAMMPVIEDVLDFSRTTLRENFFGTTYGDLEQIPLHGVFRVDLMTKTRWRPFVAGHLGYTINRFQDKNEVGDRVQTMIDNASFNGTQGLCGYLLGNYPASDLGNAFNCDGMVGPDGVTVVDGLMWKENDEMKLFMDAIDSVASIRWDTSVENGLSWGLEGGFDWVLSRRFDFTARAAYTWHQEHFKSSINGSSNRLLVAIPDEECDSDPGTQDCIEDIANSYNATAATDVTDDLDRMFHVIRLEPGQMKLDYWSFTAGIRYTFGR